jgi:hypothetical protein
MRPGGATDRMTDKHASDATVGPHGLAADHGETHGHDDHGHASAALGPVDATAWLAALGGILLGLLVGAALAISSGSIHL